MDKNLSDPETDSANMDSEESAYYEEDNQELQQIINEMSEDELLRYETFRRSNFPKGVIKKFISSVIGQAVNPNLVIAVSGLAKVYVGEMVGLARIIQKERNEEGPLLPSHIHEAHRRMYRMVPNCQVFKKAPWND
ncbi:Transcription initiation factor TFIID subunit 11 [Nosema bombycis CQ1]|jgi:transcription initiation factor TFIID subunit 11|uniref:Transcription initiation factor TFIID subunit 11 n=1 Tax=Nosema bombycis (strain CQ1 / CVCC 102059) TaxID=578461 RepID=R0MGZ1_NOSB1|nr:Transcription initiation factor TFIID subunit 11 [Nosema bombycis CQ1]EOB13258.1 Transcription initiation factor TFIID subunit 11 [Nosema bombycis CQ1]|eukprot:EOB12058.1 Transcription initiation factor TFIID subunit 11 [Nosema bombycis CQ1]